MRILAIGGSTRPGSSSECAVRVAARAAADRGAEVRLLTGRDLVLPIYDTEDPERSPEARRFLADLEWAHGLIIASPGYHGTVSGMIKNVLDYVEDHRVAPRVYFDGMPVGCIAVAHGWQAAVATLQTLRTTVHAMRGWPTPFGAAINSSGSVFNRDGTCVDTAARQQLQQVGGQVVEFLDMKRHAERHRLDVEQPVPAM